jgi:hypothetical protein
MVQYYINRKGFGNKWSWHNRGTVPDFVWKHLINLKEPRLLKQCLTGGAESRN